MVSIAAPIVTFPAAVLKSWPRKSAASRRLSFSEGQAVGVKLADVDFLRGRELLPDDRVFSLIRFEE